MDVLRLLERCDRCELADNRMTFYGDGLGGKSIYYWNGYHNSFEDAFSGNECVIEILGEKRRDFPLSQKYSQSWKPGLIRACYLTHYGVSVTETKTIFDDVFLDRFVFSNPRDRTVVLRVVLRGSPRGRSEINGGSNFIHVHELEGPLEGTHKVIGFDRPSTLEIKNDEYTLSLVVKLKPLGSEELNLIVSMSEDYEKALRKFNTSLKEFNQRIIEKEKEWINFYTHVVPKFYCNDQSITKLYYHCWYVCKCNVYKFGRGYFKYPFTSPSKFRLKPQWFWDTAFHAIVEKWMNGFEVGAGGILNILESQREDGHLPFTLAIDKFFYEKEYGQIIQPWIIPIAIWDLYLKSGDLNLLRRSIDHMVKFDYWMENNRDLDGDHLIHLVIPGESGWDNSKRFVLQKPFVQTNSPMVKEGRWIEPADFNTYLYLGRILISRIAHELGKKELAKEFSHKAELTRRSIESMWNSEVGLYLDQFVKDHEQINVKTPGGMIPMLGNIPTKEQAKVIISHLTNTSEFWRPFPVPSLSADDPDYTVEDTYESYWNGRGWPNITWQIIEGLFMYEYYDLAGYLALKLLKTGIARGEPYCTENYNPETGTPYENPMHNIFCYGWGTLHNDVLIRRIMGIQPDTPRDRVFLKPLFPDEWSEAFIEGINLGSHQIGVMIRRNSKGLSCKLRHKGRKALTVVTPAEEVKVRNKIVHLKIGKGRIPHWLTL